MKNLGMYVVFEYPPANVGTRDQCLPTILVTHEFVDNIAAMMEKPNYQASKKAVAKGAGSYKITTAAKHCFSGVEPRRQSDSDIPALLPWLNFFCFGIVSIREAWK